MRSVFESTITEEPPSRLDLDAIIARCRRHGRLRRASVATATVVGLAVVAAVPAFLGSAGSHGRPAAAGCSAPTGQPDNVPMPDLAGPPGAPTLEGEAPLEPPAHALQRLAKAVCDVLSAAAPGVEIAAPFSVVLLAEEPHHEGDTWSGPQYAFWTSQRISLDGRTGVVTVFTGRRSGPVPCPDAVGECTDGPDGEVILSGDHNDETTAANRRVVAATAYRTDGSYVSVTVDNATERYEWGEEPDPTAYTGETPPLVLAQAIMIALDARLTIYP